MSSVKLGLSLKKYSWKSFRCCEKFCLSLDKISEEIRLQFEVVLEINDFLFGLIARDLKGNVTLDMEVDFTRTVWMPFDWTAKGIQIV